LAEPAAPAPVAAPIAVVLAWIAGLVDAVAFIVLLQLFVANMSGNSVHLGISLGQATWVDAVFRGVPILLFVVGVGAGAALIEVGARLRLRAPSAALFGIEAILLALCMLGEAPALGDTMVLRDPNRGPYLLAALAAAAMGLQNAALRRAGGLTIHTTFVTGLLSTLAEEVVRGLFWLHDAARRRLPASGDAEGAVALRRVRLLGAIWLGYVIGAAVGAYAQPRWSFGVFVVPIVILLALGFLDLRRPIEPPPARSGAVPSASK
jgi:uncharacterized membrane protein YoaK (UPF0700 family)